MLYKIIIAGQISIFRDSNTRIVSLALRTTQESEVTLETIKTVTSLLMMPLVKVSYFLFGDTPQQVVAEHSLSTYSRMTLLQQH